MNDRIKLSRAAVDILEEIINRGGAAIIRKKKDDIIIQEETRKTRYNPTCNSASGRA